MEDDIDYYTQDDEYLEDDDYAHLRVTKDTTTEEVIQMLEECCEGLNHEDENYVPAIRFAIRKLRAM